MLIKLVSKLLMIIIKLMMHSMMIVKYKNNSLLSLKAKRRKLSSKRENKLPKISYNAIIIL